MRKFLLLVLCSTLALSAFSKKREQLNRLEIQKQVDKFKTTALSKHTLDSIDSYEWNDVDDKWELTTKAYLKFSPKYNMVEYAIYDWDTNSTSWLGYGKFDFTYNTDNQLTGYLEYEWEDSWILVDKDEIVYDANGRKIEEYDYEQNEMGTGVLSFPQTKNTFTYDANNNLKSITEQNRELEADPWIAYYKYEYFPDENGNDTLEVESSYIEDEDKWVGSEMYRISFDQTGNTTQQISYRWNEIDSIWDPSSKSQASYTNNLPTEWLYYDWDDVEEWIVYEKSVYTFDENGNPSSETYYYTDNSDDLFLSEKYEYTYNLSINYTEMAEIWEEALTPDFSNFIANQPLGHITQVYDTLNKLWVNNEKEVFHYTMGETSINNTLENDINIYPNPTNSFVQINIANLETSSATLCLFNIQGMLIKQYVLNGSTKLDMSDFNNGIYYYTIDANNKTMKSGKILKQ